MVLCAAGALIVVLSAYFTLIYYRLVKPDARFVPSWCRMEEGACLLVLHHPDGAMLGVPNSVPGLAYGLVIVLYASGVITGIAAVALPFVAWLSAGFSAYLAYSLFFKVRVVCPLCMVAHVLNLGIALLLSM